MKNKKGIVGIVIALAVLSTLYLKNSILTFEEALAIPEICPMSIIYQEKTDQGDIVFCINKQYGTLYTAIVKKGLLGYKNLYNGLSMNIDRIAQKFGLSYTYFPSTKGTALPIYFGIIGHPEIKEISVTNGVVTRGAKIIEAEGERLWIAFMDGLKGIDFEVVGYSEDGREITRISDNLSPLYLSQR
ncbi:MAG: hypothetical protein ACRCW2_06440 [Cellulosilyticaceae bacterium]